jgi:hypothetical protein
VLIELIYPRIDTSLAEAFRETPNGLSVYFAVM